MESASAKWTMALIFFGGSLLYLVTFYMLFMKRLDRLFPENKGRDWIPGMVYIGTWILFMFTLLIPLMRATAAGNLVWIQFFYDVKQGALWFLALIAFIAFYVLCKGNRY